MQSILTTIEETIINNDFDTFKNIVDKNNICRQYNNIEYNNTEYEEILCGLCAKHNNFKFLIWAHQNGYELTKYGWHVNNNILCERLDVCSYAAQNGNLEMLEYCYKHNIDLSDRLFHKAVENNHLNILKYCHQKGLEWDSDIYKKVCDIKCLDYLITNGKKNYKLNNILIELAKRGQYECFVHLYSSNIIFNVDNLSHDNILKWAAYGGNLQLFKYLHRNGHLIDNNVILTAAVGCHLDILKYLLTNNHNKIITEKKFTAASKNIECLDYLCEIILNNPGLYPDGCPWNVKIFSNIIKTGKLDKIIEYRNKGCPWDKKMCYTAFKKGYIDILKYLHQNGCEWDQNICLNTLNILNRNKYQNINKLNILKCVQYYINNELDYIPDIKILSIAFFANNLECFKYLYEIYKSRNNKLKLDQKLILETLTYDNWKIQNNDIELYKYCHQQGIEFDQDIYYRFRDFGYFDYLSYAYYNNFNGVEKFKYYLKIHEFETFLDKNSNPFFKKSFFNVIPKDIINMIEKYNYTSAEAWNYRILHS